MAESPIYESTLAEDRDVLNELFMQAQDVGLENAEDILETPGLVINLDDVNNEASAMANLITERLSNYYFDDKYIKSHPYIPTKIMTEMNNIRRLLKMLAVNEKAQDSLIQSISINAAKSTLYSSLTALQNSTLNIQKQLDDLITNIENIFQKMQEECKTTFDAKDKEVSEDGSVIVRGSRDFIKELSAKLYMTNNSEVVNTETGEVIVNG